MPQNAPKKGGKSRLSVMLSSKRGEGTEVADWGSVEPKSLIDLVQVVTRLGGAIRLGYTRDSGAYSVGVYLDDDRETFYCRPSDDLEKFLDDLTELLRSE